MTAIATEIPEPQALGRKVPGFGYATFALIGLLDCMFTHTILALGGTEANPIADAIIQQFGPAGMVMLKATMTIIVVGICELLSRMDITAARRLLTIATALSIIPVVVGATQLIQTLMIDDVL